MGWPFLLLPSIIRLYFRIRWVRIRRPSLHRLQDDWFWHMQLSNLNPLLMVRSSIWSVHCMHVGKFALRDSTERNSWLEMLPWDVGSGERCGIESKRPSKGCGFCYGALYWPHHLLNFPPWNKNWQEALAYNTIVYWATQVVGGLGSHQPKCQGDWTKGILQRRWAFPTPPGQRCAWRGSYWQRICWDPLLLCSK